MLDPTTKLTVTVGDLMDFCALWDSTARWEHFDDILIREGLKEREGRLESGMG